MKQILVWAVPGFLLLMLMEWLWSRRRLPALYSPRDTLTNLGSGLGSEVIGLYSKALGLAAYAWVHARLWPAGLALPGWAIWTIGLLGVDFLYYWLHRCGHEWHVMWAFHAVHHQSRHYNLSVALRQSWFGGFVGWIFYLPLALAGVPPGVFAASLAINLLYQFLIHTQWIDRLGPLERVLNTPSHHRVHHGRNDAYLDRNYGGVLIIWDRLFGTFAAESEPVSYGTVTGFRYQDALLANVLPVWDLVKAVGAHSGLNRIKAPFRWPGWMPGDRSPMVAVRRAREAANLSEETGKDSVTGRLGVALALFIPATGVTVLLMAIGPVMAWPWALAAAVLALGLIAGFGSVCRANQTTNDVGRARVRSS